MLARSAILNAVRLITALAVMLSAMSGVRAAPTCHESGAVQGAEAAAGIIFAAVDENSHAHSHGDDCDRAKDIGLYVSLFAVGHSTTMIFGVLYGVGVSAYLIDAIIGFSVVYKALDNLGAFQRWFGFQPNTKLATLIFGLFHGFGLAAKIQEYQVSPDGLLPNLLAFNVGVEIGQLLALFGILILMSYWRRTDGFWRHAYTANVAMMIAGFVLIGMQLTGYFVASPALIST